MLDRNSIIERIRKLLALADPAANPEEEECTAAALRAQALIVKYRIDEQEIADLDSSYVLPGIEHVVPERLYKRSEFWILRLMTAISKPIYVKVYTKNVGYKRQAHIVGRPAMIAYVRLLTDWITPQLIRMCNVAGYEYRETLDLWDRINYTGHDVNRFSTNFYNGAVTRIGERMVVSLDREPGMELIVHDQQAVSDFLAAEGIHLRKLRSNQTFDKAAHERGKAAGSQVDLNPSNKLRGSMKELNS
jgi:Protein of unknown function (DUF2786)